MVVYVVDTILVKANMSQYRQRGRYAEAIELFPLRHTWINFNDGRLKNDFRKQYNKPRVRSNQNWC